MLAITFFVAATIATLVVGLSLARPRVRRLSQFGLGLVATSVAFGFWTIARIINPDDSDVLEIWITLGVVFLLVGLLLFLVSWTTQLDQRWRNPALIGGLAYVGVLIVFRFIYPSEPFIDEDGVLFFNPHGSVAAMEIGAVTGALLPAIFVISRSLRALEAVVAKVAFTALVVSGIVLITSVDKVLITIASVVMALVFLALVGAFVVRQAEVWLEADTTAAG